MDDLAAKVKLSGKRDIIPKRKSLGPLEYNADIFQKQAEHHSGKEEKVLPLTFFTGLGFLNYELWIRQWNVLFFAICFYLMFKEQMDKACSVVQAKRLQAFAKQVRVGSSNSSKEVIH